MLGLFFIKVGQKFSIEHSSNSALAGLLIFYLLMCLQKETQLNHVSIAAMICRGQWDQFQERDEMNKYAYFEVLFLGREGESYVHEHRLRVLYRLASLALQYPVLQLYAQISLWLSKVNAFALLFKSRSWLMYQPSKDCRSFSSGSTLRLEIRNRTLKNWLQFLQNNISSQAIQN